MQAVTQIVPRKIVSEYTPYCSTFLHHASVWPTLIMSSIATIIDSAVINAPIPVADARLKFRPPLFSLDDPPRRMIVANSSTLDVYIFPTSYLSFESFNFPIPTPPLPDALAHHILSKSLLLLRVF